MTPAQVCAYRAAQRAAIFGAGAPENGGFLLADAHHLTASCGAECTDDGVHYAAAVYDVILHAVLSLAVDRSNWRPPPQCATHSDTG